MWVVVACEFQGYAVRVYDLKDLELEMFAFVTHKKKKN